MDMHILIHIDFRDYIVVQIENVTHSQPKPLYICVYFYLKGEYTPIFFQSHRYTFIFM